MGGDIEESPGKKPGLLLFISTKQLVHVPPEAARVIVIGLLIKVRVCSHFGAWIRQPDRNLSIGHVCSILGELNQSRISSPSPVSPGFPPVHKLAGPQLITDLFEL